MKSKYSKAKLQIFRKNILKKIEEINENMQGIRSSDDNDSSLFLDTASEDHDEGTESHEVEKNFLLMSRESDYLTNLEKALQRIDDGSYGFCEETGEAIGIKRLEARPVATLSLEAQEMHEKKEKK